MQEKGQVLASKHMQVQAASSLCLCAWISHLQKGVKYPFSFNYAMQVKHPPECGLIFKDLLTVLESSLDKTRLLKGCA